MLRGPNLPMDIGSLSQGQSEFNTEMVPGCAKSRIPGFHPLGAFPESRCATLGRNVNNDVTVWVTRDLAENRPCTNSSFIRYMGQPWFGTGLWFRNTWISRCWLNLYLTFFRFCLGLSPLPPHIFACVNLLHCCTGENHCSGLFLYSFLSKLFSFLKDTPGLRKLRIYTRIWHA